MILALLQMQVAPLPDATDSTFILFGCILFAACLLIYIFMPVQVESGEEKTRLAYLYERKDVVYENLRDLNFEYKAGKLSDADFQTMRASMEEEATGVLAEIEQLEKARRSLLPKRNADKGARA
ncbi:MAG TPA: hypothetical protein VN622_17410 [Clostridia bacterium]|nr:hypothetical protein [Clostridia bacterium]